MNIEYREIQKEDQSWIKEFIIRHWGAAKVVVHGNIYYPDQLPGYIAEQESHKVGLITYSIINKKCEIITLNSILENRGIGTGLINLVIDEARKNNWLQVWLITTNDNIRAIQFYQKKNFQLVNVYSDSVKESRKLKPEIPLFADNGLPIRDELEFVLNL